MLIERLGEELGEIGAKARVTREPSLNNLRPNAVLDLTYEGLERRFVVEERRRAPYPSELARLLSLRDQIGELGTPLLVAPYVSEELGKSLIRSGWSWADARGNYDLAAAPLRLRNRTQSKRPKRGRDGFPRSAAGLRIVRGLIAHPTLFADPLSQARLARAAGVTQPRISQILSGLEDEDLIEIQGRAPEWNREALWEAFLERYPGPGGTEHYFYSLDPLLEVGLGLADLARKRDALALSGDVGADLLSPVRRPTHLIAYCRAGTYSAIASFDATQVDSAAEANITLCEPTDDSVFGPVGLPTVATVGGRRVHLGDPTQIVWDLIRLGGRDRADASDVMKRWMLSNSR